MLESIATHGYEATTVASVTALAGVSRRAFYEQFANKQACFWSSYETVVACAREVLLGAWTSERGWERRMRAACRQLLEEIANSPHGAHVVLVDALGLGRCARERARLADVAFERLLATALGSASRQTGFSRLTARAVVGGVRQILFARVRDRRADELPALSEQLLEWVECYRAPAGRVRPSIVPGARSVRPAPAAFLERGDSRTRLLGAVVHLTLDGGYATLVGPQIADFAGLSVEALRLEFGDKEACFLTVLDEFAREALDTVTAQMQRASSWPEAVWAGVAAFLEHLAARPALLRIAFIELFDVGAGVIGHLTCSVEGLAALLTADAPAARHAPDIAQEAIVGAIWALIGGALAGRGGGERLPALAGPLSFTVLAPYLGASAAIAEIEAIGTPARTVPAPLRGG